MTETAAFDLEFLTGATRGTAVGRPGGDRVLTDSRGDVAGALFVALTGPNFDGHDFAEGALAAGATGAVVSASWWGSRDDGPRGDFLVVPDTLLALQDLARAHRARHPVPLAAVTGSNGKTTTKELLAAALASRGPVLRTRGNRNNHLGLPLTLLELVADDRAAVVEIGLNHPGELRMLSGIARPRVAVITNVAAAHLEGLGTLEGVARAKAEIVEGLEPDGVLVLPHGLAALDLALEGFAGRRVTFGFDEAADVHPARWEDHGAEGIELVMPDGVTVRSPLPGRHTALNALAALAAAEAMGVPPAEAAPALAALRPLPGRLRPVVAGGVTILDDSYNANPASLAAALCVLRRQAAGGRPWAVLGDMLELGEASAELHHRAGEDAAFVAGLVTVGPMAAELGRGAVSAGLDPSRVHRAPGGLEAAEHLLAHLAPGDVVLVKASRGTALESAVERLAAALGEEG